MKRKDIYISMDVEADGPCPGLNNMLSFGAAAFDIDKRLHGTFGRNLNLLPDGKPDPKVMHEFWDRNPTAWKACRVNPADPKIAMIEFCEWVSELAKIGSPVFVGYPAPFDFKWIDYYCYRFTGNSPFGHSRCLDAKTFAWSALGGEFSTFGKRQIPRSWFEKGLPHTHIAEDDAIEQGAMFINMLRDVRRMRPVDGILRIENSATYQP